MERPHVQFTASPVITADGTLYLGSPISSQAVLGEFVAVTPAGQMRWQFTVSPDFKSPVVVGVMVDGVAL